MRPLRTLLVPPMVLGLVACAAPPPQVADGLRVPQGQYRLLVMPDVSVGTLNGFGTFAVREDWSEQARQSVARALLADRSRAGVDAKIAVTAAEAGADPGLVEDLVRLHKAVGGSIRLHKFSMYLLPTKQDRFDWTLGSRAVELGAATHYDYALFVHAEDSFSSSGRIAAQVVGLIGCPFELALCLVGGGGAVQTSFASLVDLRTGRIVWFHTLRRNEGDIRTRQGADRMVAALLQQ